MQISTQNNQRKKIFLLLMLIMVAGGFLRFHNLGDESLWYDELLSWDRSRAKDSGKVIELVTKRELSPWGHYLILHYLIKHVGSSEFVLRFPSAICGILSIFVIFLLGCRLYSYKEGIMSAFLMAFLHTPIYYSQEARSYSLLLFSTLSSVYFLLLFLDNLKERKKIKYSLVFGYVFFSVLSCYSHYFGIYFIGLQILGIIVVLIPRPKDLLLALLAHLFIVLSCLPLLPVFVYHFKRLPYLSWIRSIKGFNAVTGDYFLFLFNGSKVLVVLVLVLSLLCIFLSVRRIYKKKSIKQGLSYLSSNIFLIAWLVIPLCGSYIFSLFYAIVYTERNLIISLPAAYLLLSFITVRIFSFLNFKKVTIAIILVFTIFSVDFYFNYHSKSSKEQFKQMANFISGRDHLYPDSMIVAWGAPKSLFSYYLRKQPLNRKVDLEGPWRPEVKDNAVLELNLRRPKYLWYVRVHLDNDSVFLSYLHNNFQIVDYKQFSSTEEIWLFKNNKFDS